MIDKKIVISTHFLVYGAPQALREYLMAQKASKILFIGHPLQIDNTCSYVELIEGGNVTEDIISNLRTKIPILNYILEIFLTLKWAFLQKEKIDLWVGVDSLNAFCGIVLKKIGKVKKVIYYSIDFYPKRFENIFFNKLYYQLDKVCVKYCNETWNVSAKMIEAREKKYGKNFAKFSYKQKTVPIGVWFERVKRKDITEIKRTQAVFVGHLNADMGVDLVIRAIPEVLAKIPSFEFLLIGGGDEFENLRKLCQELKIESSVIMTGWVKDRLQLEDLMAYSAVGLAPFNPNIADEKFYNADPTKIKDYLVMGMPVILTSVPSNALQLKEEGCAIIVDYNENSLADAIVSLMQDDKKLRIFREKSINFIEKFDWNIIFKDNLTRILQL